MDIIIGEIGKMYSLQKMGIINNMLTVVFYFLFYHPVFLPLE